MKKVRITYSRETGNRVIEVEGIKGPTCDDLLSRVEEVIGPAGQRTRKDDYFDTQTNQGDVNKNAF